MSFIQNLEVDIFIRPICQTFQSLDYYDWQDQQVILIKESLSEAYFEKVQHIFNY